MGILATIWAVLNSPAAITAVVAVVAAIIARVAFLKGVWEKYAGVATAAVRMAEKAVPDNAENKAIRKLDEALKYLVNIFTELEGRAPTPDEQLELRNAIEESLTELQAQGIIPGAKDPLSYPPSAAE